MIKTSRTGVLIVEDVELEAKLLMRALADFGYTNLTHCSDVPSAIAAIESKTPPQIVVTDLALGAQSGSDLTRAIRARDAGDYIYVVMLTGIGSDARLREAFAAGVDDFVVKPARGEEMVARIRAGERIVELEARLRVRSKELETALRRIDVSAAQRALAKAQASAVVVPSVGQGLDGLLSTPTWSNTEEILANSLAEFFQLPCTPTPVNEAIVAPFVADVLLSDPARQLEIGISVLADDASMKAMALHLFGEEDAESAKALILEIGNTMMGTLKTAFIANGLNFTGGIPADLSFRAARAALDKHPIRHRLAFKCGEANIEFWLRARERKNTKIRAKHLVEGMVIGEDVHDAKGMLLIRAGSRLTQTAADRISRFAPDLEVVVGNPNG